MSTERRITARFDLEKVKTVKDVALGEEVTIQVTGKVVSMRSVEETLYKDSKGKEHKESYPGTLEIEIGDLKVVTEGEFDGLGED